MTDWNTDGRRPRGEGRGPSRQDRLEGDDYGGMGVQGAEWRRTDSGGGYQGEERFGHSGGIDSGYGGQSGKAGWGPLSQGSSYGQGGAEWGHSGWEGGHRRPRSGERATYGQGGADVYSAQRSRDRTTQYDPDDREGFVAYGRAYGDVAREDHAHDHEPGYRDWHDRQMAAHDADYRRWRDEQSKRYHADYKSYRDQRHDTFSKGFDDWRSQKAGAPTAEGEAALASSSVTPATPGAPGGAFDVVGENVRNIADGGQGHVKHPHDHGHDPKRG